jgi:excisionase family DNA binding protein
VLTSKWAKSWGTRPDEKCPFVDKFEEVAGDVVRPQFLHAYDRDTHIQPRHSFRDRRNNRDQERPGGRRMTTIVPGERLVLTVAEAGELLGISRAFAYELVARGELPVIRLGRRIVVPKAALLAMVDLTPQIS